MMAHFVDEDMMDEVLERLALRRPFVEDSAAVEENPVGQGPAMVDAFSR